MTGARCRALAEVAKRLQERGVDFALIHESAIMAWGLDDNAFLSVVDVLLLDDGHFAELGGRATKALGQYISLDVGEVPTRLWSRESVGLRGPIDVTQAGRYGCECLAPELVLAKLPYSPDARLLVEQRAKLAAALNAESLTDEELELYSRLVKGA